MNLLKKIFKYKYFFSLPSKKKIYLATSENNLFKKYLKLKPKDFYSNSNSLNLFIILKVILYKKSEKSFFLNYFIQYLKSINAEVIITNYDNNIIFWKLKKYLPDLKVIILQNGIRLKKFDIFEKKILDDNLSCDYFFTFNNTISTKFSKLIKSKFISIGSFQNNGIGILKKRTLYPKKTLLFISEFLEIKDNNFFKDCRINIDKWYLPEKKLLPFLFKFCKENNFELKILPRTLEMDEYNFYLNIFKTKEFIFLDKKKINSYHEIDKAYINIFISSTLGYEALARKNKVAAFSTRKIRGISGKFGWPSIKNKKDGYFWTNSLDIKKFSKILNNLIKINDKDWIKISRNISNKIMKYDKKNSKLKSILKKMVKN